MNEANTSAPTEVGTTLRGWFYKEKRYKVKRRHSIVSNSNRRWFQIEKINKEQALCYYKRLPKNQDEQPTGFFFLNDFTSLSQHIPNKMITLEHPSRTLRLSSPSLAQHTHSYSALVRSCPNARTDSSQNGSSLPFYTGTTSSVSTAEKQKSNETSAKDELSFLKEITGNDNAALSTSSSDSGVHDTSISTSESEKEHDLSLEGEREEEKTAIEPLYYRGDGKQDDTEAFSVDQLQEGLQSAMMDRHESSHPPRSNSFGSHQIQTSSSFRLHFGNEDIQPDEDFLCDDWDD